MLFWLIPLILLIASLLAVGVIIFRKIPQLRVMNIADLPEEKVRQVKELILQKRFERNLKQRFGFLTELAGKSWKEFNRQGRKLVQKVYAIEQRYRKMQKSTSSIVVPDNEVMRKLMDDADSLVDKEEYFEAEKKYIEILSRYPKYVKAYEALGNLYMLDRKNDQARETFAFALKLKADDASVHAALGELENKEGNYVEALAAFSRATEIRPNNPRYLDFFIEAAIEAKNAAEAQRGLNKLKEVNPENKKLVDFEERITGLGK